MKNPEPKERWTHRNGNVYVVLMLANEASENTEKYPVTVVYRNVKNKTVWSRKLSDWHRSFTLNVKKDDEFTQDNGFLKRGADKCPDCHVSLHWEQLSGMRITREIQGAQFYGARCPKCFTNWRVRK